MATYAGSSAGATFPPELVEIDPRAMARSRCGPFSATDYRFASETSVYGDGCKKVGSERLWVVKRN